MKKLLNPFTYLSGEVTLALGLAGMAVMIWTAGATQQTFRGILSFGIGERTWLQLAGQLLAGWAILSGMLYAAARIFSPSRIRLVDIAGNQAMAKLPNLLTLLSAVVYSPQQLLQDVEAIKQLDLTEMQAYQPPVGMVLSGVVSIVVLVWFFAWSWQGFSIAANLRGRKAVFVYIGSFLIAEVLASVCTSLLQ